MLGLTMAIKISHLRALEAESIHIFREVAAEFQRPVMLYSVGKDSSVMLRLAQKAFHPGPIPFPLLHVDTTYKFREMIEFRDRQAAALGLKLIVHSNTKALDAGANPFRLGTERCCGLLKTQALLDALRAGGFDAAFGGARRDEEKSRAKERIFSFRDSFGQWDPKNQRPELWNLDRTSLLRQAPADAGAGQLAPVAGTGLRAAGQDRDRDVPHALAGLLALHRCDPVGSRYASEDHRGTGGSAKFGTRKPRDRS
jgi:3'-phosphoadenosine 5'-phosphosulfate sulfotransferase (PAPS reductase)/FAD synthetase